MRLRTAGFRFAATILVLATPLFTPCAQAKDEPGELEILASVAVGLSPIPPTEIRIQPDGATRITQAARTADEDSIVVAFRLTTAEMAETREAVVAAHYFEAGDPTRPSPPDSPSWHVVLRLGDRHLTREDLGAHPDLVPLARHLFRFVRQAHITAELRTGRTSSARGVLMHRFENGCVHPPALVDEIVACAAGLADPRRCGEAAALLVSMPVAEWLRGAKDLLERVEGEQRGAALGAWSRELRQERRAPHRAAFAPIALAEVTRDWRRWPAMGKEQRIGLESTLAGLLRDGVPRAFEVAAHFARAASKPGKPRIPEGLLSTGERALPVVRDLLDGPEAGARECGAQMARFLIRIARKKTIAGEDLAEDDRAALERRLGEEIVPVMERLVQDASASYTVRQACLHALDRWDGRVKASHARAKEAEKAARKRAEAERARAATLPEPAGALSISGRLLGPDDIPLPGFTVWAFGKGTWPAGPALTAEDGSFRLEGLAAGSYDLGCTGRGQSNATAVAQTPRVVKGVAAGSADVFLRLPGALIRGRLFLETGAPAVGYRIVAQMRDAPHGQWSTYSSAGAITDAQGRFWLVRLMPGIYDLQVPGRPAVRGADGVEAGSTERTVQLLAGASISGRVVDETGAPLPGALLSVREAGKGPSGMLQTTHSAGDGTFRFVHLPPGLRYAVGASFRDGGDQRDAVAKEVAADTADLVLRIDTSPRLRLRIDYAGRGSPGMGVRLESTALGRPATRIFRDSPIDWRGALPGTWRVFAKVSDVDANGMTTFTWIELGTVTTGEPEKTLVVPR